MLSGIVSTLLSIFLKMGYAGIVILMAFESSIIPIPSELVIPPFAYLAHGGDFNIILVILFGTTGNLIGALINYFISASLGRFVVYKLVNTKIANLLLINEKKLEIAENYFNKNGEISIFLARLIPVVRHLISIPAGLSKMNIIKFSIFTVLGSLTWNTILAILGYSIGSNKELIIKYSSQIGYITIIIGIISVIIITIVNMNKKRKSDK